MRRKLPPKTVIIELGLHAESFKGYVTDFIRKLVDVWPGWPRVAIKTQYWNSTDSTWFNEVVRRHGRRPLTSLSIADHEEIASVARQYGFLYGVTAHDVNALERLAKLPIDFIKLGHRSWDDSELVERALTQDTPIVGTVPNTSLDWRAQIGRLRSAGAVSLVGSPFYPSRDPYSAKFGADGFSCHLPRASACSGMYLAIEQGAQYLEFHSTRRSVGDRPMPGDMPVSLHWKKTKAVLRMIEHCWDAS